MSRPKKKEISLNKESVLSLMQEIYNELVEQRATAIRIQNKMLAMMKEPEDMTLIGPVIEKQQKIVNECVDKKLALSKLHATQFIDPPIMLLYKYIKNPNNKSYIIKLPGFDEFRYTLLYDFINNVYDNLINVHNIK